MSEQYFGERVNTSEAVERPEMDTISPEVNSEPFGDKAPEDAALVPETPVGWTDSAVGSLNGPLADEIPMQEAPVEESPLDEMIVRETPMSGTVTHEAPVGKNTGSSVALLGSEESEHFRTRWNEIQGEFVDEPRSAVQKADALVSEVIAQITQRFATEHSSLEVQWNQGNDVSTEDLRIALQHYRSFFNRLVV